MRKLLDWKINQSDEEILEKLLSLNLERGNPRDDRPVVDGVKCYQESVKSGNLDTEGLEKRSIELKGVSQPISVRVMKV